MVAKSVADLGPSWEECMALLESIPGMALDERADVIERLLRNPSPGVRERALRVGVAVLSDGTLIDYLRSDSDAVLRNAALEILKERGGKSYSLAVGLLHDKDPDVVLQAILILDHIQDPRAVEPLRSVLGCEDPNVIQAAIVAIGHLGDARAIPDLLPFLKADPWVQLAAVQALGDLRSAAAVSPLSSLLPDLMLGPIAAEAIAKIGGARGLQVLARHWMRFQEELDPETNLGLLAHVLEGLARESKPPEGLRNSIAERLRDPYRGVRVSAARCLLALGGGPEDGEALNILAEDRDEPLVLPSCLIRRRDLIHVLLSKVGILRSWGFLLAARHPRSAPVDALADAVAALGGEDLSPVARAFVKVGSRDLALPLLDLYLRSGAEARAVLAPTLKRHRAGLLPLIENTKEFRTEDLIVLEASLGRPAVGIHARIMKLSAEDRAAVIPQLLDRVDVLRKLPWADWLEQDPDNYLDLAGQVAVAANLRELLPLLRDQLLDHASVHGVRAVGELRDTSSVPVLIELLQGERPQLMPLIVESLGKIGGPEARMALREIADSDNAFLSKTAFKALSECAIQEDDEFFRNSVAHSDWYVRLACAEVLGRYRRPENLEGLTQLAADPVAIVAQRALALLEN